jgi:hypothetical protein
MLAVWSIERKYVVNGYNRNRKMYDEIALDYE